MFGNGSAFNQTLNQFDQFFAPGAVASDRFAGSIASGTGNATNWIAATLGVTGTINQTPAGTVLRISATGQATRTPGTEGVANAAVGTRSGVGVPAPLVLTLWSDAPFTIAHTGVFAPPSLHAATGLIDGSVLRAGTYTIDFEYALGIAAPATSASGSMEWTLTLVPEPGSAMLAGLSALTLLGRNKRPGVWRRARRGLVVNR